MKAKQVKLLQQQWAKPAFCRSHGSTLVHGHFYSQKPIETPADVEGLKIRVMNNDLYTSMISAMGGNPSPMAFAEVQQALKTGVVDGAENNFPSFKNVGHYEVTTHYSLSEHLIIPECICVNTTKFNALSAEMQAAVRGAAEEAACSSVSFGL